MKKSPPLWCEDCRFVCFETGLGNPMLTLNDPNGFKTTTNVYSIHLELRMALPCQIGTGKWKYVNPCLDFLGSPDQRTAYVKRQARPRWTYVRRSSVTPDLYTWLMMMIIMDDGWLIALFWKTISSIIRQVCWKIKSWNLISHISGTFFLKDLLCYSAVLASGTGGSHLEIRGLDKQLVCVKCCGSMLWDLRPGP